jgi:Spy/CpxP family protein refolding chaperone
MRKVLMTIMSIIFVVSIAGFAMAQAQGQDQGSQDQMQDEDMMDMENMEQAPAPGDQGGQVADQDKYRSYHMMPRWWERPRVAEKIKLRDDQRNRIRAIYDKNSQDLQKMRTDMRAQGKQLREMLTQDKLDENAITKQIDMVSSSLAALVKAELQMNTTMMNELDPDQRKQLVLMYEQFLERMKQRKGMRKSTTGTQAR